MFSQDYPERSEKCDLGSLFSVTHHLSAGMSRQNSIALWRSLVDRFPGNCALAQRFLAELIAAEKWDELDRARSMFSSLNDPLILLTLIDSDLSRRNFRLAQATINTFRQKYDSDDRILLRQYRLFMFSQQFTRAGKVAAAFADGDCSRQLAQQASFYGSLQKKWKRSSIAPDYLVLVINLDESTDRLDLIDQQLMSREQPYVRVPGVKGAYLPDWTANHLTKGQGTTLRGSLGCFLSHVAAWESFLRTDVEFAIVLEDDACILAELPPSINQLGIPSDFDICFINERAARQGFAPQDLKIAFSTIGSVLETKSADWGALGTDGYIITRTACRKLLSAITRDGIAGDIDWRLLAYSLSPSELSTATAATDCFYSIPLQFHSDQFQHTERLLTTYCAEPALVRQNQGGSIRLWDDQLDDESAANISSRFFSRFEHSARYSR